MNDKSPNLDPRITASSLSWRMLAENIELRLANDSRWPWLLLLPVGTDLVELDDLSPSETATLFALARRAAIALRMASGCPKTNIATIGNVVPQFHLHVIGRKPGDPNWPAPIWGYGRAVPYKDNESEALMTAFDKAWNEVPDQESE